MMLRPVTLREARRFVAARHSHNEPPRGWLCGTGVEHEGRLVAVGILGRPVARGLQDGVTAEITRVATDRTRNACTMAYGAMCRAAEALGYTDVVTYTLEHECAACVRAAGFELDDELPARPAWDRPGQIRHHHDLFGADRRPPGAKVRWRRRVARP